MKRFPAPIRESLLLLASVSLTLSACTRAEQATSNAPVAARVAPLGISGGRIPIPVAPCEQAAGGADAGVDGGTAGAAECDPASRPVVWDGTYAELLAADAFAECTLLQAVERPAAWTYSPFVSRMLTLIGSTTCPLVGVNGLPLGNLDSAAERWIASRRDPRCNAAPSTGAPLARDFDFEPFQRIGTASAYYVPEDALPAGVSRGSIGAEQVQIEAVNPFVDLCIAQKLREHIESDQSVFAAKTEVDQLHTLARDRALSATLGYAMLTSAFAVDLPETYDTSNIADGVFILPVFGEWRRWAAAQPTDSLAYANLSQIGRDFALVRIAPS